MSKTALLKHRIHHMLQGQHLVEPWAALFNLSLASLIILNVLALMAMGALFLHLRAIFGGHIPG